MNSTGSARGWASSERDANDAAGGRQLPQLDGVEHRFVQLPGLRMHVAEAGAGEPLLLLHGVPQHWWEWRKVIPELAQHHRVIVPDLRGAGWTEAPTDGYGRDSQLADVVALLDALGVRSVGLLSHDYGALLGYQLCLRHPDRITTHLALSVPPPYFDFDAGSIVAALRHAWFALAVPVPGVGPALLGRRSQWLARVMLHGFLHDPTALTDDDAEAFLAPLREPARARAVSTLYRRFIQPEGARIMRGSYRDTRLATPTRVLIGAADPNVRPEFLHGIEPYVDDLTMEYVEGAGHYVADERPTVVVERALELFAHH